MNYKKKYNLKNIKLIKKFLKNSNIYSIDYISNLYTKKQNNINNLNYINKRINIIIININFYKCYNYIIRFLYLYLKHYIKERRITIQNLNKINELEIFIMKKYNIKNNYISNYLYILNKKIKSIFK
jgi:hypothetical protein